MSKLITNEGAIQYDHSYDNAVEFFSKAGSIYSTKKGKKAFYGNETTALELFKAVWFSGNYELSMKLLFWLRDCRGGSGNRSAFRESLKWLAQTDPKWIIANIDQIPKIGRWDDLRTLNGTVAEQSAVELWSKAIAKKDGLACKWADRSDNNLLKSLRKDKVVKDIGDFRRLLSEGRKNVVERAMCSGNWNEIKYPQVPSVAMSRYTKAFGKHDPQGFENFKVKVEKGESKINASVLFPHDLVRIVKNGDCDIADAQFKALPNWVGESKLRIMVICDSSGSMSSNIGGSVQAIDVSTSLALYCSDRIPENSPFHRKFIQFESESKLSDWKGHTFSEAYGEGKNPMNREKEHNQYWSSCTGIFNGAVAGTRIDKALDMLLTNAQMFGATNDQVPNLLLIISDMQFSEGGCETNDNTVVENCLLKWELAGYNRPKVVYWNVAGYAGSPSTVNHKDGNKQNNIQENWVLLCRQCHMRIHKLVSRFNISHEQAFNILLEDKIYNMSSYIFANYAPSDELLTKLGVIAFDS